MLNICCFQFLKCESLLLFCCISLYTEYVWVYTVGQAKHVKTSLRSEKLIFNGFWSFSKLNHQRNLQRLLETVMHKWMLTNRELIT